jgi:hypothetical protein
MRCHRCQGLMVAETALNLGEGSSQAWLNVIRCVNCGCMEDPLICVNRVRPSSDSPASRARRYRRGTELQIRRQPIN